MDTVKFDSKILSSHINFLLGAGEGFEIAINF